MKYRATDRGRAVASANRAQGFSLIEILVALVIIGLLASVVAPNLIGKVGGAKSKTARIQIEDLSAALELYYLEVGTYPTTQQGLAALVAQPEGVTTWNGPYLRKSAVPDDPWGAPYHYEAPGKFGPFGVWSYGIDGEEGGEGEAADILSWE